MTDVPDRPLVPPWLRLAQDAGRTVLGYGGEVVVFEGRAASTLLPALLPLLDGTRTIDEVVASLGEAARPAVENALALLARERVLVDGPPLRAPAPFAAASLMYAADVRGGSSPAAVHDRLAAARVAVVGSGATAAETGRLLRLSGVGEVAPLAWDAPPGDAALAVVAPEPDELVRLPDWNAAALAASTVWLQVLPSDGVFAALGPLYVPGETCCYECYRHRRAANVDYPREFWALERTPARFPVAPALVAAVAGLATTLALRWIVYSDPFVAGVLAALELGESVALRTHVVHRVPRCPACSEAAALSLPLPWAEAS